jgi:sugar/nucleoside kinase (ribokinase family)
LSTSIPEEWEDAYKKVLNYAKEKSVPIAFSPGTRQIEDKNETTIEVVKNSKYYFSNREEAAKILGIDKEDIKKLLQDLKALGPDAVSITDGPKGAYAIDNSGTCFYIEPSPNEGKEKTGAGDAYATGFLAAMLSGQNVQTAMKWGCLNSGGVMQHVGAQNGLLTKKQLEKLLKGHDNLKAQTI